MTAPIPQTKKANAEFVDILLAEKSLYHYTKQIWHLIEPKTPFLDNWHIKLLCDYLQCISENKVIDEAYRDKFSGLSDDGRINYLLICMPPRCMKSICISIALPTWHWTHTPGEKFICGASNYKLAVGHSTKCRRIIQNGWYQARWGEIYQLSNDQNTKQLFQNTIQGERVSVSVDSKPTGLGGDILIADDFNDMNDINSETIREHVLEFWNNVFSTRENNFLTSRKIIMQQRGHAQDVAGDILSKEKDIPVTKLILKARATEREEWYSPLTGKLIHTRETGELLWPSKMSEDYLKKQLVKLTERGFEAQFQQSPQILSGNIIKINKFRYLGEDPEPMQIIMSVDTAFKTGEENDYSVCTTWYRFMHEEKEAYYLKSVLRERLEFPKLKEKIHELAKRYKPNKLVIEDKASGQSLIDELKQDAYLKNIILPVNPDRDKVSRAYSITPTVEQELVFLPVDAHWSAVLKSELAIFPNGAHDDQVDSFVQALQFFTGKLTDTTEPSILLL
jgi:predicted phage terminase large subunit-like protein